MKLSILVFLYIFINILYSFYFKNIEIIDVFCISFGFIIRIIAGAIVIGVYPTHWILLTSFFISLFLGFGKRRAELSLMNNYNSSVSRKTLFKYNQKTLDVFLFINATLAVISYSLYTIDISIQQKFDTTNLIYTVPFVIYGILRYILILFHKNDTNDPVDIIFNDKQLQLTILFWIITIIVILL